MIYISNIFFFQKKIKVSDHLCKVLIDALKAPHMGPFPFYVYEKVEIFFIIPFYFLHHIFIIYIFRHLQRPQIISRRNILVHFANYQPSETQNSFSNFLVEWLGSQNYTYLLPIFLSTCFEYLIQYFMENISQYQQK